MEMYRPNLDFTIDEIKDYINSLDKTKVYVGNGKYLDFTNFIFREVSVKYNGGETLEITPNGTRKIRNCLVISLITNDYMFGYRHLQLKDIYYETKQVRKIVKKKLFRNETDLFYEVDLLKITKEIYEQLEERVVAFNETNKQKEKFEEVFHHLDVSVRAIDEHKFEFSSNPMNALLVIDYFKKELGDKFNEEYTKYVKREFASKIEEKRSKFHDVTYNATATFPIAAYNDYYSWERKYSKLHEISEANKKIKEEAEKLGLNDFLADINSPKQGQD